MEQSFLVKTKKKKFDLTFTDAQFSQGKINGKSFVLDVVETKTGFHVIQNGICYNVDILSVDHEAKHVELRINHKRYAFDLHDQFDELLHKLGMDKAAGNKVSVIKAPMPGLVLDVIVKPGEVVTANQPLLILEAMKMENVIKSPSDGTVKSISVMKGASVEKNQVLVEFA